MPDRTLIFEFPQPIEELFPFFSDANKFVDIHPVIYKCQHLKDSDFQLFERLKLIGNLGFSFSYPVTFTAIHDKQQVTMTSQIRKGVHLELLFDFKAIEGKTILTESVTFTGPFFIRPLFIPFLAKVHTRMVAGLGGVQQM